MTTQVRTARPNSDAAELAEMMIRTGIKSVPVLEGAELVGMVSRRDLLAVLARGDARIRDDVIAALREHGAYDRWTVTVRDGGVELRGEADDTARRLSEVLARTVPGVSRVTVREPADRS
ncbi:CBS domain-containing protein [Actinomadura sp. SCN-SB]|uniref:CBS domain-containing protein n=1 Tax=Actinomadura sp. SCN-SB TaxID=3373092 RepID=UPI00375250E5